MNYQELIDNREGNATLHADIPIGTFYRKLIDRKYKFVVELKPDMADSLAFCEALKTDQNFSNSINDPHQLHYTLQADSAGVYALELETGNYLTLSQVIDESPAIVAKKGFIDQVIGQLMDFTTFLHNKGALQLCFAPQAIFMRKGSELPMTLFHGSHFLGLKDELSFFKGFESWIAPEVLAHEAADERSDVFGLGRLISYLYESGDMPLEMKMVVKKATAENPDDRYYTVDDMKAALAQKRNARRTVLTFVGAVAVVALCIMLYFDFMPQKDDIEFVNPPAKEAEEDPYDASFDPDTELGIDPEDTTYYLSDEERHSMEEYQAKSEEIFRRRFKRDADKILSKVYNNEYMQSSERNFVAASQNMTEELMRLQLKLAEETGVPADKAGKIATEITTSLSQQKQEALSSYGYQREKPDDEAE